MKKRKTFLEVIDFPGLVRAIASFHNLDEDTIEFDFSLSGEDFASVSEDWIITGNLVKLNDLTPTGLLFMAAHEIGHIVCDHFNPSWYKGEKEKLNKEELLVEEDTEADAFALQYSTLRWDTEWDWD